MVVAESDFGQVALKRKTEQFQTGIKVPDDNARVLAGGDQPTTVTAECCRFDSKAMADQRAHEFASSGFSEADRLVAAGRDEVLAVRAEGHVPKTAAIAAVTST